MVKALHGRQPVVEPVYEAPPTPPHLPTSPPLKKSVTLIASNANHDIIGGKRINFSSLFMLVERERDVSASPRLKPFDDPASVCSICSHPLPIKEKR